MKKLSREELEKELRKESQATWILTIVCALVHAGAYMGIPRLFNALNASLALLAEEKSDR